MSMPMHDQGKTTGRQYQRSDFNGREDDDTLMLDPNRKRKYDTFRQGLSASQQQPQMRNPFMQ